MSDNDGGDKKPKPPPKKETRHQQIYKKYSLDTYMPHYFKDNPHYFYIKLFYETIFGSILAKTSSAPLDRIRTLMQVQHVNVRIPADQRYKGLLDCCNRVYKEQGIFSLWRGNLTNCIATFPHTFITLSMKQVFSNVIVRARRDQPMKLLMQNMLSGGLAGALQIFLMYPFSFVQTRLQADVGTTPINREFRGIRDCVRKIYKTEGTQSFYRGLTVSLSGVFVYRALYFGMYDCGLTLMLMNGVLPGPMIQFMFGTVVTIFSSILAYPFDVFRRRIMVQQGRSHKLFNSGFECFQWTMLNEGYRGFYRGLIVHLMKSYNSAIITLMLNAQIIIQSNAKKE